MKTQLRAVERKIITTIFITFLICKGLHAAEETLPTPEEIIAKNIEAIGGIKALKRIKNKKIVTIRKHVPTNTEYKDIIYSERPDKGYRLAGGGERNGSIDGRFVWEVAGPHALLQEVANPIDLLFDGADGPDAHYKSMKTEDVEQINGKACYKVVKTPEKGPERTVYYDKNTYMIVKTIVNYKVHYGTFKQETYYEEYKKMNGILFPYKEVEFQNGQIWNETTIEKMELNIEMPEGIFDIPEKVKEIIKQKETGEWNKFDGTWKGTVPGPDGNALDITYVFDSSGYDLTGSVSTKLGGGPFNGCKVEGNKISFSVYGPGAVVHLNGTLSGDVINMIQKKGDDVKEFILKRVKE